MAVDSFPHPGCSRGIVLLLLVLCSCSGCYGAAALPLCSFSNGQYMMVFSVREDLNVGATITTLNVTGDNSQITLAMAAASEIFDLDPVTRELKVKKLMDGDKSNTAQSISIICTQKSNVKVDLTLLISLIDVNEHPPKFDKNVYTLEIGELTPVGTTLLTTIQATDHDVMNQNILYELKPGNESQPNIKEYFNMPMPGKGILQLVKQLDYEVFQTMSCLIIATDQQQKTAIIPNPPTLTGTATLQITVKDGDNRNPVFVGGPFTGKIQASSLEGTLVTMDKPVKAVDGDSGIKTEVIYTVPDTPGVPSYFSADPRTGAMKLAKASPPAGTNIVTVMAYQKNAPLMRSNTTRVTVTVQGTNAVPPSFSQHTYTAKMMENSPLQSSVIRLLATDKDAGSILTYALDGTSVFDIGPKDGVISLVKALDYEKEQSYVFNAHVNDGTYTSTATVSVMVEDVNDNDPVFSEPVYTFKYNEGDGGKVFGKVMVTDKEKNSNITLSLREYTTVFSVSQAGEVRMIGKKGDIRATRYQLVIDAVDNGSPPRRATGVAIVTFPPAMVAGAVGPAQARTEVDLIPLIILACLCGLLLLIIIGLIIYIHKSRGGCCHNTPSKNRRTNKENNLMYYSNNSSMNLNEEDGHTPVQTNPLALTNPGYYTLENGIPGEDPRFGSERQISEIQLDTAVAPLGHGNNNGSLKSNGSGSSYEPNKSGMSTFKTNPKGKKYRNNKDRVEVYNAENAIQRDSNSMDGERPGITVYF